MATWEDVATIAGELPEVVERSPRDWRFRDKMLAWERPLRDRDHAELGDAAPEGPILGVWVADLGVKDALIADEPEIYFTTSHFNGYRAVLVQLDRIPADELRELIVEAWLDRVPKRLAAEFQRRS